MADIRYICLSDTHFGEEDSLLTNLEPASSKVDPKRPSPVMQQLAKCLKWLISKNKDKETKPTLILNGDILELALATTSQAAMVFERFMELIMPPDNMLFDKIVYVPGNHDHHLWELARETQYVDYIDGLPPKKKLPEPYHATNMFMEDHPNPVCSYFLTRLIRRSAHLQNFIITAAYPNFGVRRKDGGKYVIFHHGHFIEPLYHAVTTVMDVICPDRMQPRHVWDVEEENFAWIDFFWSALPRSGEAGQDIERLYEQMHDWERFKKRLSEIAVNLARRYDLPGWSWMESGIAKAALHWAAERIRGRERYQTVKLLSKDAQRGLWSYVNGPMREQLTVELEQEDLSDVTIVFGHTHKPYEEDVNFKRYPDWVNVYNTGGWVVESVEPEQKRGGALVLVDENLDTVSLRMYNEDEDPEKYSVVVKEAKPTEKRGNPFYRQMLDLVDPQKRPWIDFSAAAARAVRVRAQDLRARINEASG